MPIDIRLLRWHRLLTEPFLGLPEDESPVRMKMFPVVVAVCASRQPIQLGFRNTFRLYQSLIEDQANRHADRECTSTKAKSEDFISIGSEVAASKLIERDHVSAQAYAECATKDSQRLEGRGPHAVVVACHLIVFC